MSVRTAKEATFALLRDFGMTTVFGNPGSTELRFLREWPADFRYVTALQEASAVAMADGYAQITRNAALVNLHSAGGLGNAMGSVFTAFKNQTPLVITAGQQTRAMLATQPFLYAEDATMLPRPYVKWSCEPARGQDVPAAIARAYWLAMQRPYGPTFVSIPEDDWDVPAERAERRSVEANFAADPAALENAARKLSLATRPAIVVGPGVDRDDANDLAVSLAQRLGAAVWVSPLSSRCSFPEGHPWFAGFLPPVRASVARILAEYDVVLVLGAPIFTYHVHSAGPFVAPGTAVLQFTDDPSAAASAPVGDCIVTTLRHALTTLLGLLPERPGRAPAPRMLPARIEASDPIAPAFVFQRIARTMPRDAYVFEEAPSHRAALHDYFPIEFAGSFFAGASGSLGWALPAAVGAALAAPGRRIVVILGDGSAMYSIQALWTAAAHRLPIAFIVFNNRSYAAMNEFGRYLRFEGMPSFALPDLDFVRCAQGFNCRSERVERARDLDAALAGAFASEGPMLLDVIVDDAVGVIY